MNGINIEYDNKINFVFNVYILLQNEALDFIRTFYILS